jgi:tRNA U55 pseudouridine synthase TruB
MQALERRRVGGFGIDRAVAIRDFEDAVRSGTVADLAVSIDAALSDMPAAEVTAETAERVCHGVPLPASRVVRWLGECRAGRLVRVRSHGVTVALATAPADHAAVVARGTNAVLKIDRVLWDGDSKVSAEPGLSRSSARSR